VRRENKTRAIERSPLISTDTLNLTAVLGLETHEPDPIFWVSLDIGLGISQISQDS
jgi:hypothetical protein